MITYLYQKNIFGDIVKIVDSTGQVVGEYSLSIFGGTAAVSTGLTLTGTQILVGAGAIALGLNILFAQTRKSGGYYGERWPGDPHKPDHVHLRGNGIDVRIGKDGKPLPGESKLGPQAKKALKRLWEDILKLFER